MEDYRPHFAYFIFPALTTWSTVLKGKRFFFAKYTGF